MQLDQAKFLLDVLLPQVMYEHATTQKIIAAIPAGKEEYTPDPVSMDARKLAWHIASSEIWFLDAVINGQFASGDDGAVPENIKTGSDVVAWYKREFADRIAKLPSVPNEKLATPLNFFGVMNEPAVVYLSLLMRHSVHHRGQLSAYLRPMGAKVPAIYGGSADEPFQPPQQSATA